MIRSRRFASVTPADPLNPRTTTSQAGRSIIYGQIVGSDQAQVA